MSEWQSGRLFKMSNNKRKFYDLTKQTTLVRDKETGDVTAEPVCCEWDSGHDWRSVAEMGANLDVNHITAVDPGEKHMGVVRIQLSPEFKLTHWKILDLQKLCVYRMTVDPSVALTTEKGKFTLRSLVDTVTWYVQQESSNGGPFDSELLIVESQDFRRNMKAFQVALTTSFNCLKKRIVIHPAQGGSVPAAQTVSSQSKCACYGGLFPQTAVARTPVKRRRRFHGPGDVATDPTRTAQYAQNKQNSRRWGAVIAPYTLLAKKIGATYTEQDQKNMLLHIEKCKTDDIYDAFFLAMYALCAKLPNWDRRKRKFILTPIDGLKATVLRKKRQFEELRDLMRWLGVDERNVTRVHEALFGC